MANRVYTLPLNYGTDKVTDDILLEPGYVRKAHNMEVVYGGGLRRIKGWANPWELCSEPTPDFTTKAVSNKISLMPVHQYLFAFRSTSSIHDVNVTISRAYALASNEGKSPEKSPTGHESPLELGWQSYGAPYDDSLDYTTYTTLNGHAWDSLVYTFSGGVAISSIFGPEQSVAITYSGDIIWGLGSDIFVRQHDSLNHPTHFTDAFQYDPPTAIGASQDRFLVGAVGGLLLISAIGEPWEFDTTGTASTMQLDGDVTNIIGMPDNTIFISTNLSIYVIYPAADGTNDADSWELKVITHESGAYARTAQRIGNDVFYLSDGGVTSLSATQKFGNFQSVSKSSKINPIHSTLQGLSRDWLDFRSTTDSNNSQYILFDSGFEEVDYNEPTPRTETYIYQPPMTYIGFIGTDGLISWTTADYPEGALRLAANTLSIHKGFYFTAPNVAGTDVEVKKWKDGWSQDGEAYTSYLTTPYDHFGAPYIDKTYRKVNMTVTQEKTLGVINPELTLDIATSFDNGVNGIPNSVEVGSAMRGSDWSADAWGDFVWGDTGWGVGESYLSGNGQNVSVTVSHSSASTKPYTIKTLSFIYENRRVDH